MSGHVDQTKIQHERAVGDRFIRTYNEIEGTGYVFSAHADDGEAPDLVYLDRGRPLWVEVTSAYYDGDDARVQWGNARGDEDAPKEWSNHDGAVLKNPDPEGQLIRNLNAKLADKCSKRYRQPCLLVIYVSPGITTGKEFDELAKGIVVPKKHAFEGIYVAGDFGTAGAPDSPEGYWVWRLDREK